MKLGRTPICLVSLGAALALTTTAFAAQPAEYCGADKNVVVSTDAGLDAAADSWNSGAWAKSACVHVILTNGAAPIGTNRVFGEPKVGSGTKLVIRKVSTKPVAAIDETLDVAGADITVYRLKLLKGLRIGGDGSRALRNEVWNDAATNMASAILIKKGKEVRVGFNTVHSSAAGVRLDRDPAILSPRIDHNLFADQRAGGPNHNLHEPIQIGQTATSQDYSPRAVVEWNYIRAPKVETDDEAISVKTSDNIIRYNTIVDSARVITNRQGHNNQYIGNYLDNAVGITIFGADNKVIGNYINAMRAGHHGIVVMAGNAPAGTKTAGRYPAALRTVVSGNTSSQYTIGAAFSSVKDPVMADRTTFTNNAALDKSAVQLGSCASARAFLSCENQTNTSFRPGPAGKAGSKPRRLSPGETGANGKPWVP